MRKGEVDPCTILEMYQPKRNWKEENRVREESQERETLRIPVGDSIKGFHNKKG